MTSQMITFEADLYRPDAPGSWTYLTMPCDVEALYGSKSRIPVKGMIDGQPFRSSLIPQGGGTFILVVNKEIRNQVGKHAGDSVTVIMEPDSGMRTIEIPEDLYDALAILPQVQDIFEGFSYSHQKEYVDWITSAKKAETRSARIEKALVMIADKKKLK
jgi:hypothetical protein